MDNARTASVADADAYLDIADIPPITIRRHLQQDDESGRAEEAMRQHAIGDLFQRLPDQAIESILYHVDANTFASLVLVNRRWRSISQSAALYAHHLSRCPSFALTHNVMTGPFRMRDLERFRAAFNQEVRRNLFEAYLRPRQRLINLISVGANTSAALPRGEAFRFIFSSSGGILLALSSSRIYVLDVRGEDVTVRRELKTLRRPIAAAISDDGSMLSVLSTAHQVNIYGLTPNRVQHLQVLVMEQPPRTIALAQEGTVLAVAYESAVEVFSLAPNALSTDRRAVRCEPVDSLAFSEDGSMLVGSSRTADPGNTVVITAPYYTENDPNLSLREIHSRLWTTQILFPTSSSTCHLSSFLPSHSEGDAQWLVGYDHLLETFRAVRTDDTRIGVVYFIGPRSRREIASFKPTLRPATTSGGDLVVTGFDNDRLYIYGVPQKVDIAPDMSHVFEPDDERNPLTSATVNRSTLSVYSPPLSSISSDSSEEDDLYSKVDWRQSLFVKGRRLVEVKGATDIRWVENLGGSGRSSNAKRLVVAAPGGVDSLADALGEEPMPLDGGRLLLFDFDYTTVDGPLEEITIEVGESAPELLPEHHSNIDVEVALERRRSVMRSRDTGNNRSNLNRAATAGTSPSGPWPSDFNDPHMPRVQERSQIYQARPAPFSDLTLANARQPPQHTTAANPPRGTRQLTSYLSNNPSGQVAFYRQTPREIPHESDADNWVPPPPPYRQNTETLLPPELRLTMLGTFSEAHRRAESVPYNSPSRTSAIPEEAEVSVSATITDLSRSTSVPRPSYRTRPLSDSSLSSISDWTTFQQYRRADRGNSRDSTVDGIVSPMSGTTSSSAVVGVQRSNGLQASLATNDSQPLLQATLTHPTSPIPLSVSPFREPPLALPSTGAFLNPQLLPAIQPPHLPSVGPITSHPQEQPANIIAVTSNNSTPSSSPSTPKSITLTGKNLQQRLNYPTPPVPQEAMAATAAPFIPVASLPTVPLLETSPPGSGASQPAADSDVMRSVSHDSQPTSPSASAVAPLPSPLPLTAPVSQPSDPRRSTPPHHQWPQHRRHTPPQGRHIDPNHLNSTNLPVTRSNTAPDANMTTANDFACDFTRSHQQQPGGSSSRRVLTHPIPKTSTYLSRRRSTQASTTSISSSRNSKSETIPSRLKRLVHPFSSTSSKPSQPTRNRRASKLASIRGGYGPHGTGRHAGSRPEIFAAGTSISRMDTIHSVPSNLSEGQLAATSMLQNDVHQQQGGGEWDGGKVKGTGKGKDKDKDKGDKEGKCVIM